MEDGNSRLKIFLAGVVALAAVGYIWGSISSHSTGLRGAGEVTGMAAPPERQRPNPGEMRERMAAVAQLTPEQQEQMDALRKRVESDPDYTWMNMREDAQKILTPEQQARLEAAREQNAAEWQARGAERRAQREKEAKETLSPADFKRWQEKEEEARERRRQMGFGPGGGGPGGGGWGGRGGEGRPAQ